MVEGKKSGKYVIYLIKMILQYQHQENNKNAHYGQYLHLEW